MSIGIDVLDSYGQIEEAKIDELLKREIAQNRKKLVVLDDDPTGVQTVHDVTVYTDWNRESIRQGFEEPNHLFYILTNSRGFTEKQTIEAHREIAEMIDQVSKEYGKEYLFLSRSDSTLRGHYPLETEILRECCEKNSGRSIDGEILCPFFQEGGRFTVENVHYVKYGNMLIPVNETEFAEDPTFGYHASSLPEYVEEKTEGRYLKENVVCISLQDLRGTNFDKIEAQLLETKDFQKVVVNAADYMDLKVFCIALYRAMAEGKQFLFRTAASMIKIMGGVEDQPLLTRSQMIIKETSYGGIIVAGSHTDKTVSQIECLKEQGEIEFIELDVSLVADDDAFEKETRRCLSEEESHIKAGRTVCCYTRHELVQANTGDKEDELRLAVRISQAVQSLIGKLQVAPAFIVAKGGITSSDVGTKAMGVKKAHVLGQIRPGIPVWQTGEESKFPGIPFIIFPGNVGERTALREVADILRQEKEGR